MSTNLKYRAREEEKDEKCHLLWPYTHQVKLPKKAKNLKLDYKTIYNHVLVTR